MVYDESIHRWGEFLDEAIQRGEQTPADLFQELNEYFTQYDQQHHHGKTFRIPRFSDRITSVGDTGILQSPYYVIERRGEKIFVIKICITVATSRLKLTYTINENSNPSEDSG